MLYYVILKKTASFSKERRNQVGVAQEYLYKAWA
jgi:hypothetical protein